MSEYIFIAGKQYRPSIEMAGLFGYTSDYVGRLARERKVVASNVNNKWYVQVESMEEFVENALLEKQQRNAEIKKQRLIDKELYTEEKKKRKHAQREHMYTAGAQSFAVVGCGLTLGILVWTMADHSISPSDFINGASSAYEQIKFSVIPNMPDDILSKSGSVMASVMAAFSSI